MIVVIEFFGIIILSVILMYIGYSISLRFWDVKNIIIKLKNFSEINTQLTEVNKQQVNSININNEIIHKNKEWYLTQLKTITLYIKDRYGDTHLENQLNVMYVDHSIEFNKQEKLDLDKILDKINETGINSLTIDELEFLRNNEK